MSVVLGLLHLGDRLDRDGGDLLHLHLLHEKGACHLRGSDEAPAARHRRVWRGDGRGLGMAGPPLRVITRPPEPPAPRESWWTAASMDRATWYHHAQQEQGRMDQSKEALRGLRHIVPVDARDDW